MLADGSNLDAGCVGVDERVTRRDRAPELARGDVSDTRGEGLEEGEARSLGDGDEVGRKGGCEENVGGGEDFGRGERSGGGVEVEPVDGVVVHNVEHCTDVGEEGGRGDRLVDQYRTKLGAARLGLGDSVKGWSWRRIVH